jgi:16S rRNA (guanine527-N7)-methyltransferase
MIEALKAAAHRDVSRETFALVEAYVELLRAESERQNLIAPSTVEAVWDRHILDSAQLVRFEPRRGASWADIGSGAGLPGLIVALLTDGPITLIEPRRLRAEFLRAAVQQLGLSQRVRTHCEKVERISGTFDVITARAVASLDGLLAISHHLSTNETVWILPKGRNAQSELAQADRNWQCETRVEQSCTDPDSGILVLTRVGAKKAR